MNFLKNPTTAVIPTKTTTPIPIPNFTPNEGESEFVELDP
ncbi:16010_t:CDS:2 [Gigaspora rosea]|nr:16010_t:CDS:2 [Gigaspora rosea]